MASGVRPVLRVEGVDGEHVIRHVLIHHGVNYVHAPLAPSLPLIQRFEGGKSSVLSDFERLVRASTGRSVGFVLDADTSVRGTWDSVKARLRRVGVEPPAEIPADGFVGHSAEYRVRVGVWLMPDNQQEGARGEGTLERFLEALVREADPLLPYAREATRQAKAEHGARYGDVDVRKAELHAWLAWQEEPGVSYGTAIKARYFRHDTPVAESFVAWFRRVFEGG